MRNGPPDDALGRGGRQKVALTSMAPKRSAQNGSQSLAGQSPWNVSRQAGWFQPLVPM